MSAYSDAQYADYDPFELSDRDVDIRCRTVRVVKTRSAHLCSGTPETDHHDMAPGTRARYERAIVDGSWGAYYVCLLCMDKWLNEIEVPKQAAP
jgi:hypothetical protein